MINGATIVDDRVLIDLSATVPDSYSSGLPYRANQALMCIAGGTAPVPPVFEQDFLQVYDFDEDPLTTNYSTIDSVNPVQSTTGGAAGTVDGFESAAYVNSLPAINNSQFAEITLVGIPTAITMIGVLIRGGLSGSGFYAAMVDGSNLEIRRYTGVETFDLLASVAALTGGGSRIKFSIDTGFVLTAYVDDVQVLTTVDPDSLYGTGFPGIVDMGDASTSAKITQLIIGDFTAGTPGSGSPVDPDLWKAAFPFQDEKFGVVVLETDPGVTGYNCGWRTDKINGCLIVNETLDVARWINGWPVSIYDTVCVTTGVPAPGPFTVSLDAVVGDVVTLDWTAAPFMDTTDEYEIFRDNVSVGTVPGDVLTFDDTVPAGGTYDYKVVASNPGGSTTATPDPLPVAVTLPGAFSGTATQIDDDTVTLDWTLPVNMTAGDDFNIYRDAVLIDTVAGNILTYDDTVTPATYDYRIEAVNGAGSTFATPDPITITVIAVPGAFTVSLDTASPTSVVLDWTAASDMVAGDEYEIFRDGGSVGTVAGNILTFDDTTVPGVGTYNYQVVATNVAGSTTATPDPLVVNVVAAGTTWNPADKGTDVTLSNSNRNDTGTAGASINVRSIASHISTGKYYFEVKLLATTSNNYMGIADILIPLGTFLGISPGIFAVKHLGTQFAYCNGSYVATGVTLAVNDVLGMAVDFAANKIWFSKNGVWMLSGDPATGANPMFTITGATNYFLIAAPASSSHQGNFASADFIQTPPAGFGAY